MRADLDADPRCSHCGAEHGPGSVDDRCAECVAPRPEPHDDAGDARALAWLGLDEGALL